MRHALAALAILVLAAGCGGSEQTAGSFSSDVAEMAPASAPLVLALETDPESEQWGLAQGLLDRFPGKENLLDELSKMLSQEGINVEQDLLPALGDDTYVVLLDFENGGDNVVVLTQPRDPAKLRELLRESDEPVVLREVEGWTLLADSEALLDRFTADGDHLADADWFQDAQGRTEDDALVTMLANGAALQQAGMDSIPEGCELPEQGELRYAVGTLAAQDDGVRLLLAASGDGAEDIVGNGTLLAHVPAGALAYLGSPSFDLAGLGLGDGLRCALDDAGTPDAERALGTSFDDVLDLFAGGFALSVRSAAVIPEVTLLLEPADEARAIETLDGFVESAGGFFGVESGTRRVGEVDATEVRLGPVTILYGAGDGRIVITTQPGGFGAFGDGGDSLENDERFRQTRDAAGAEDDADVFAYFDLNRVVELVDTLAALGSERLTDEQRASLEPLESFLVWGDTSDPNEPELGVFLEIR